MGDLPCGSERVPMEGNSTSFICKDDTVLLEETLPPVGPTPCSGGEFHHSLEGTHKQGRNVDSLETQVVSGSISSGTKRGKGDDGNSHVVSQYSESKESSNYERSLSFPPRLRLVSAMKGGREKSGEASPTEDRRVKWAPDVYDPPVTSVDHSVKSHQQRPRSRKKDKIKQKRKSRGNRNRKKSSHDAVHNPPALQVPGSSSPDELGEILDYGISRQEPKCGSVFVHGSAARMHFSAAEAS